jgi:hypothetical protein
MDDLRYGSEAGAYRERIRSLIAAALPAGWRGLGALPGADRAAFLARWRVFLHDNGFLVPGWPAEYGGRGRAQAWGGLTTVRSG